MLYLTSFESLSSQWQQLLSNKIDILKSIDHSLNKIANTQQILPPPTKIFSALNLIQPDKIKTIIIGQDPYHGNNQANGLAFAVTDHFRPLPPSLYNIYKEILLNNLDYNQLQSSAIQLLEYFKTTNSQHQKKIIENLHYRMINQWPQQGVLLLNSALTVIAHQANSLQNIGWQEITSYIIQEISLYSHNCVFMLWGSYARALRCNIKNPKQHLILEAPHPSPLSAYRGFFGCRHFITANRFLQEANITPIKWIS